MDAKMKALFENMKAQNDLLSEMLKGDVKKDAGVASNAIELHGAGSLFANAGLERDIITAHVRPQGISTHLPLYASVYESPLFGSITGFTAEVGAEPAYPCSDAPTGYMKGCNLTAAFGRIKRDTNTIEIDRVMLKYNRGDHSDLLLRGSLLGLTDLTPSGLNQGQVLDVVTMAEMVIAGINVERKLSLALTYRLPRVRWTPRLAPLVRRWILTSRISGIVLLTVRLGISWTIFPVWNNICDITQSTWGLTLYLGLS
jgi:hypothetical protein